MAERIRRWAAWPAVAGGLIVVVATVVDWLTGVGSINDPMNPRWREAVALLTPGFVIAAFGVAGMQAHHTKRSMVGLGGAAGMVAGFGIASVWLGYAALQADYQRRPKESRANRSSSSLCTELDAPEKKPAKLRA